MALGRVGPVTIDTGVATFRVKSFSPKPVPTVSRTLKLDGPAVVGLPLITPPPDDSDRPAGNEPETIDHVRVPPGDVATRVWEGYVMPTTPSGRGEDVVMVICPKRSGAQKQTSEASRIIPRKTVRG